MNIEIRHFQDGDAADLSTIISRNLREVNSQDYASDVIESLVGNFAPDKIIRISHQREMFVAEADRTVVGTASLARDNRTSEEKYVCLTVFVLPECHGSGVGKRLMARVEETAHGRGARALQVPASVTALPFYRKLGYTEIPTPEPNPKEFVIWMSKSLGKPKDKTGPTTT